MLPCVCVWRTRFIRLGEGSVDLTTCSTRFDDRQRDTRRSQRGNWKARLEAATVAWDSNRIRSSDMQSNKPTTNHPTGDAIGQAPPSLSIRRSSRLVKLVKVVVLRNTLAGSWVIDADGYKDLLALISCELLNRACCACL